MPAEFDSWYEESFLGALAADKPPGQAASAANVAAGKQETLSKADTCVRYTFDCYCRHFHLVSGINSRLLSVDYALISPILTHPVLRLALPPSVPSTHRLSSSITPSLLSARSFKVSLHKMRVRFFQCFNSIYAKSHSFSEPVMQHLVNVHFPSLLQILPSVPFFFLPRTDSTDFPDYLPIPLSMAVFTF